jgi:hypothetical protein
MPLFQYTAQRQLQAGHVAGSDQLIIVNLQKVDDEQPRPVADHLRALGGKVVTTLHRIETYIDFRSNIVPVSPGAAGRPYPADFQEFFHSISGGETFLFTQDQGANLVNKPLQFDDVAWSSSGTPVVVADVAAGVDGKITADSIQDNDGAATEYRFQAITGFDATLNQIAVLYVKKDAVGRATRFPAFRVSYSGSTVEDNWLDLDTATGEFNTTFASDAFATVNSVGEYWELIFMISSTDQANTAMELGIFPARGASGTWVAGVAAQGTITVWNAQTYQPAQDPATCRLEGAPARTRNGLFFTYSFRAEVIG